MSDRELPAEPVVPAESLVPAESVVPAEPAVHPDVARLQARQRSPWADALSRVFDPAVVLPVTLLLAAWSAEPGWRAIGWALLATLFSTGIPLVVLGLMLRRGAVDDRNMLRREQRMVPMTAAVVSVVVGVVLLWAVHAPAPLFGTVVAVLAGTVLMTVISRWFKASIHVGVLASATVVLTAIYGAVALVVGVPVMLATGWARVRAGRHSLAQVVVGGLVAGVAGLVVLAFV